MIVNGILKFMEEAVNVFHHHPEIECYVDGTILSVDSGYRGCGIGVNLFNGLIDLCRKKDIPIIEVFCSSTFTGKICAKLDFTLAYQIPYRDIQLDDLPSIDVPEPHSVAHSYIYDLRLNQRG